MSNANFITQFEYRLNNLTGSETQADLLSLRATADKYPELDVAAVALLDAAIDLDADALTNSSTIKELVTVGNADAEPLPVSGQKLFRFVDAGSITVSKSTTKTISCGQDERIVVTTLYTSSSGNTDFTLDAGSRRVFNQGDMEIIDSSFGISGVGMAIRGDTKSNTGSITFGIGESLVWNNASTVNSIYMVYQIEQVYEG